MNAGFPAVSLLVLTHQQRSLIDGAVASAFAQDCEPIEIVLSDDGSSDGSHERLLELASAYRGPHRVRVRPHGPNVGIAEHYNQLHAFASGELFITAAGDDASAPDRVRRLVDAWNANGRRADLIASHLIDMDLHGRLHDTIRVDDLARWPDIDAWFAKRPYIVGASHAYTRRMLDRFGPMDRAIAYEDQIMVFRAIASGGAITVDAPLVHYRRGGTSRSPSFDSVDQRAHWTERQLDRILAEMKQLAADAQVAGCAERMQTLMARPLRRDRYLRALMREQSWGERWRLMAEASELPLGWRLRKVLHSTFPSMTFRLKRFLQLFHRRYWSARRSERQARREDLRRHPDS